MRETLKKLTRLAVVLSAVAALFVVDVVVTTTSAAAAEAGPYQIINYNSGLCLDVADNSTSDGAVLHQWGCEHGSNQMWHFKHQYSCEDFCRFTMIPDDTYENDPQECLTLPWSHTPGDDAHLGQCEPSPWASSAQGFSIADGISALPTPGSQYRYRLINWFNGMCLEIQDGSVNYGAPVQQTPCDGSAKQYWIITSAGSTSPDFSLSLDSSSGIVNPGGSVATSINLTATGGFTGAPTLSIQGLPSGVTATFSPNQISASSPTSTLRLTASSLTPLGTYPLTISTNSTLGGVGKTVTYQLAVAQSDFSLSLSQSSGTVVAGGSVTTGVNLSAVNGFAGTPNLTIKGLPQGVSAAFSNTQISASHPTSTLTLTTAGNTPSGTYPLTISTDSPLGGTGKSVTYQLTVHGDFSLFLSLNAGEVMTGGSVTTEVTLTAVGGFTGTPTLSIKGLPSGVTAVFSPGQISASDPMSTLTLTAASDTASGVYPLTIGTDSTLGGTGKTLSYQLTVDGLPQPDIG